MFPWIHAVSFTSLLICFKILYTLGWVLYVSCSKFVTNLSQGYKGQWCVILQPVLPKSHPHLLAVHPVLTDEEMTTESLRYNCFNRNGRNAIPKQAGPEAKGSNPTTGLTLFRAHNPFRGNFNHWQVPQKDTGQILFKWRHGYEKKKQYRQGTYTCHYIVVAFAQLVCISKGTIHTYCCCCCYCCVTCHWQLYKILSVAQQSFYETLMSPVTMQIIRTNFRKKFYYYQFPHFNTLHTNAALQNICLLMALFRFTVWL